jgi:hypothetical protein
MTLSGQVWFPTLPTVETLVIPATYLNFILGSRTIMDLLVVALVA